jgi:hypothetical protein
MTEADFAPKTPGHLGINAEAACQVYSGHSWKPEADFHRVSHAA